METLRHWKLFKQNFWKTKTSQFIKLQQTNMKKWNFKVILFLFQTCLTAGILYAWLTFQQKDVWADDDHNYFSTYYENETNTSMSDNADKTSVLAFSHDPVALLDDAINEIYVQEHAAALTLDENETYKKKFQDLCFVNLSSCMKMHFDGEFTYKDRYIYLASFVKIIGFIDAKSINLQRTLSQSLEEVNVTKDEWKRRGHSTHNNITINVWWISSYIEFFEVLTHEIGHVVDLWILEWEATEKDANFTEFGKIVFATDDPSVSFYWLSFSSESVRTSTAKRQDFVSGYGMTDPFEDFSECFNAYLNHNAYFKYLAKNNPILRKKYNFIANYFDWEFLNANSSDVSMVKKSLTRRPFDTTKIVKS